MTYAKEYMNTQLNDQDIITHEQTKGISINKYVASTGAYSRRSSEVLIKDGQVKINESIATLGDRVNEGDLVYLNDQLITPISRTVYIMLNKPVGITCSTNPEVPNNIAEFMNYKLPIFPIGRLDKKTTGLILLTNDGDIVNKLLRKEFGHEKEYVVEVNKPINQTFIDDLTNGVTIYNLTKNEYVTTDPAIVNQINDNTFSIILKQGLNRQIRRMCGTLGFDIVSLKRIRFMHLLLNDLPIGQYRYLSTNELLKLQTDIHK